MRKISLLVCASILCCSVFGQNPVQMSSQTNLTYTESFSDIANWTFSGTTGTFSAGTGANAWKGYPAATGAGIPNANILTTSTLAFTTSTSGGVQKGTGNLQLLSTGANDNTTSAAMDLFLNFTTVNAGTLSLDVATVNNATGDRKGTLRVYASTDGSTWTELTGTGLPYTATNNVIGNASISSIALPSSFSNNTGARLRFYYHNGAGGSSGSRPKISIDNVTITATSATTPSVITSPSSYSFGQVEINGTPAVSKVGLTAFNMTPSSGTLTITAPHASYQVSRDSANWSATTTVNYNSNAADSFFIRFVPQVKGPLSGDVAITGGGLANAVTVAVSGTGLQNYYLKPSGTVYAASSYGTNSDGSGTSPENTTGDYQVFHILNRSVVTLPEPWTVSGIGSKVVVGNGSSYTKFVIPASNSFTGTIDVADQGTLEISNTTLPTFGILAKGSTVLYKNLALTLPNIAYHNLALIGTGTKTFAGGTYTVNGYLEFDGTTINAAGSSPFTTVRVNGDVGYYGTVTSPPDANSMTLQMGGTENQRITGNGNTVRLFRLQTLNPNTVQLNVGDGSTNLLVGNASGGGITLIDGSVLDLNSNDVTLFPNTSNSGAFSFGTTGAIAGNEMSDITLNRSSSTALGTIRFTADAAILNSLTLNHTGSTNNTVTLGSGLSVSTLNLSAGLINLGNNNLTVTQPIEGGSSSAYVKTNGSGKLIMQAIGSTAVHFPVGNSTYNPVSISNGSGLNWSVNVADVINNMQPSNSTAKAVLRTWDITPSGTSTGATLTFHYNDAAGAGQVGASFSTTEGVQVWHYNGSYWNPASGSMTPNGTPGGLRSVTLTDWTRFSPFAIANVSGPLPVIFSSVKATKKTTGIQIDWTNMTETDVLHYLVERSVNGRSFGTIAVINASGNNGGRADYSYLDATPLAGIHLYRIRAVGLNSKSAYSSILKINTEAATPALTVYPNPVSSASATLQLSNLPAGPYAIRILTAAGQVVTSRSLVHSGGSVNMEIPVNWLSKGLYTIQLTGTVHLQQQFIKQ